MRSIKADRIDELKLENLAKGRNSAYMQITRKCNNSCVFCSNPSFEKDVSFQEIKKRIDAYHSNGITEIVLTGGEPTECGFIFDCVRYIRSLNMFPKMITNGVNLSDIDFVKKLRKSGLDHCHISIHSHKSADADMLSDVKGHGVKALQGVRNAIDCGMMVNINTTINSVNAPYLSEFISYLIRNFPDIPHYIFNNLDLGDCDKQLISRAWDNKWVIARLKDVESQLAYAMYVLNLSNKTFRIERVPLCYMQGFEEFSTETRRIIKNESYRCIFIEKGIGDIYIEMDDPTKDRRHKSEVCSVCKLNGICAGLPVEYAEVYGDQELFPVFKDTKEIISRII